MVGAFALASEGTLRGDHLGDDPRSRTPLLEGKATACSHGNVKG